MCTHCSKAAHAAAEELKDKDRQPKTWRETNKELFDKWEKLLEKDLAQGAENKAETERETT